MSRCALGESFAVSYNYNGRNLFREKDIALLKDEASYKNALN